MIKARVIRPGDEVKNKKLNSKKKSKIKMPQLSKKTKHILLCHLIASAIILFYAAFNVFLFLLNKDWYISLNKPNFYPPSFIVYIYFAINFFTFICLLYYLFLKCKLLTNKPLLVLASAFGIMAVLLSLAFFVLHLLFVSFLCVIALFLIFYLIKAELIKINKKAKTLALIVLGSILILFLYSLFFVFVN